jgi:EAL domain-containing protein (putative c-di-GMP-specific phosphodiesterase class I)
MGIKTIAEFVENSEIEELLRGIGVDFVQGYGIAKPRPLEEILQPQHSDQL